MQTWTHEKLVKELLKAQDKFSRADEFEKNFNTRLEKLTRIESELMRRLSASDAERRKTYKEGYDQGRFDEAADSIYEIDRPLKPMNYIGTFPCALEFKGKLPKKERIE